MMHFFYRIDGSGGINTPTSHFCSLDDRGSSQHCRKKEYGWVLLVELTVTRSLSGHATGLVNASAAGHFKSD
jgi:hypothetical protein